MLTQSHPHSGAVRAGDLDGPLRPRIVGLAEALTGPSWFAVLIEEGAVEITGEAAIHGPSLVWRPWRDQSRALFTAGTVGTYVLIGASALTNAVGHMPESRDLRDIADSAVTAPLRASQGVRVAMHAAFRGILRELALGGPASHAVVESYLRIILVEVFRAAATRLPGPDSKTPSRRVFTRFSALVERHFRDRWTVNAYADALGVTRDRLGDVCHRVHGSGPKELIDRRVMIEARLQLETSGRSVQEVAGTLGFGSAAQFNRFFARQAGAPPGAYRASYLSGAETGVSDSPRLFDWP